MLDTRASPKELRWQQNNGLQGGDANWRANPRPRFSGALNCSIKPSCGESGGDEELPALLVEKAAALR
jgi:hypothetical protein